MAISRGAIPGTATCVGWKLCPSKTRSPCTSSETSSRSWRSQNSAICCNSVGVQTRPAGLCGELISRIFSRPVMRDSTASKSSA